MIDRLAQYSERIRQAVHSYSLVLADAPSTLSVLLNVLLRTATHILIPITEDAGSLTGARVLLQRVRDITPVDQSQPTVFALLCRQQQAAIIRAQAQSMREVFDRDGMHTTVREVPDHVELSATYASVAGELLAS